MKIAAVYIHIPFCLRKCNYCDFVSYPLSECGQLRQCYPELLLKELALYAENVDFSPLRTIYFGGGTPSLMEPAEIARILAALPAAAEVTLEANPETLDEAKLLAFHQAGINRLSMGVQSFKPRLLQAMGREHKPDQAREMVAAARQVGFDNINIDLIYGLPEQTLTDWQEDLDAALALDTGHISLYSLAVEEGTPWWQLEREGAIQPADQDLSADMLEYAIATLSSAGYRHYEISNFALPGRYSRHNTAYWQNVPYLGIGASAHSYNGYTRSWNVPDLRQYCDKIESGNMGYTLEQFSFDDLYNDFVLTSLRTMWGLDLDKVKFLYGNDRYMYCLQQALIHIQSGNLIMSGKHLRLTRKGLFISDTIMSDLFYVD